MNQTVNVNSFYFKQHQNLQTYPKQIEVAGQRYDFIENGLRLLIHKGQRLIELFDMTDGVSTFRLRREAGQWTLIDIRAGV